MSCIASSCVLLVYSSGSKRSIFSRNGQQLSRCFPQTHHRHIGRTCNNDATPTKHREDVDSVEELAAANVEAISPATVRGPKCTKTPYRTVKMFVLAASCTSSPVGRRPVIRRPTQKPSGDAPRPYYGSRRNACCCNFCQQSTRSRKTPKPQPRSKMVLRSS